MLHIRKFKHIRVYLGKIGTSFKKNGLKNSDMHKLKPNFSLVCGFYN